MKKILMASICQSLLFLFVIPVFSFSCSVRNDKVNTEYSFKTFQTSNGWGYSIMKEDEQVIRQEQIPVIQGNIPFKNEDDAEKVARLVADKLNAGEMPTVTMKDLKDLEIVVN
jgi:hypothetical protein